MSLFKSTVTPTRIRFILYYLFWLIAVAMVLLVANYYGWIKISPFPLSIYAILYVRGFITDSKRFIIHQVSIDEENRYITFHCFHFWRGQIMFKEPFDELKVEIIQPIIPWRYTSPTILFFRNIPGDFYVSKGRNRFSKTTLTELVETLRRLTSPAKKADAS